MLQSRLNAIGTSPHPVLSTRAARHVVRAVAAPLERAPQQQQQQQQDGATQFEERFALGEVLGCGSSAEVKVALRRDTREEYAVKTLSKLSPACTQGPPPEIENWQRMGSSPHVTQLEGIYEDADSYHIVQELCYGGDLQSYLERHGHLDEAEAAQAMRSVLEFLADCHSANICYGDVKPANFLLKSMYPSIHHLMNPAAPKGQLQVKAADMGSSQQFCESLKLRRTVGTIMYMAPEMFTHSYGCEVDMWSTGVMMFQLLTGRFPFWDVDAEYVHRLSVALVKPTIHKGDVIYNEAIWAQLSPAARDLVEAMLQKDPRRRITAQQALQHPWFQEQAASSSGLAGSLPSGVRSNILPLTALHSG